MIMKEYKLVEADDSDELSEKVSELLKEGWELYGQPFIISYHLHCYQAVVKSYDQAA